MRTLLKYLYIGLIAIALSSTRVMASSPDSTQAAQLLDSIAMLSASENFVSLLQLIDHAEKLYDSLGLHDLRQSVQIQRGSTLRNMGRYQEALLCFIKLLGEKQQSGDSVAQAQILNHIGATYRLKGEHPAALDYYNKSLELYTLIRHDIGRANVYNNIGIVYLFNDEYDKALEYYSQAYELYDVHQNLRGLDVVLLNIGEAYRKKKDHINALKYYEQALDIAQQINDLDVIGTVYIEAASINIADGKLQYALPCLDHAMDAFTRMSNQYRIAECELQYGDYFQASHKYSKAIEHYKQGLRIAQSLQLPLLVATAQLRLSQTNEHLGNTKLALQHYKAYMAAHDSLFNSQHTRKLIEVELSYNFERQLQQQRIDQAQQSILQEKRIQHGRTVRQFIALTIVLLCVLMGAIIVALHESRQKTIKLQLRQTEIVEKNEEMLQQQEELIAQRDEIERKSEILKRSKRVIGEKNRQMVNSIEYAQTIQNAMLPSNTTLSRLFDDHLLIYRPKNIVSGDFYWVHQQPERLDVAVMDCTGHGVPGAFLSLIGNMLLNQIVKEQHIDSPADIIDHLDTALRKLLKQENKLGSQISSIDVAYLSLRPSEALFSGANRPLIMIQHNKIDVLPGTLRSAGGLLPRSRMPFELHRINLHNNLDSDTYFYLTTDGFPDQMNGHHKKYGMQNLYQLLHNIHSRPMSIQQQLIVNSLDHFSQGEVQIDDICLLGIKLKHYPSFT